MKRLRSSDITITIGGKAYGGVTTVERGEPPTDPATRVLIGTTSNAPAWTAEQLAQWLSETGACSRERAAEVAERIMNPPPVTVVRVKGTAP